MALKVKAVERLLKFDKESTGTYRYVMTPEMYSSLSQAKVIKEAALRSGVSQGVMQACWDAAGEVIKAWATEGHSVALPGLGTMRFGLRSKSVDDVNKVKSSLITSRRIIFTPDTELKDELAQAAIQITCYDRNGNEVKRVTSTSGDVEDPEDEPTGNGSTEPENGDGENQNGENQNQNGGNTNTGDNNGETPSSVAAPTISGASPFALQTEVTLSAASGAAIHYTTDGSVPTSESQTYSAPFVLSSTTVVKAIAIKDGVSSDVASKTFTKSSGSNDD